MVCPGNKTSRKGYVVKKGSRKSSRVASTCVKRRSSKKTSKKSTKRSGKKPCKSTQVWRRSYKTKKGTRVAGKCKKASQPTDYMHRLRWTRFMNLANTSSNSSAIEEAFNTFLNAAKSDSLGIAFLTEIAATLPSQLKEEKTMTTLSKHYLDPFIQSSQTVLKLFYDECDGFGTLSDEQEDCINNIMQKYNYLNTFGVLNDLYKKARSFDDLLYLDYAFLDGKLYGTFSYDGKFGEGDGDDHVGGDNLKTMVKYGLLTVNGQSNDVGIQINSTTQYNQYSYVDFYAPKELSEKLYLKLKDNPNLTILVRKYSSSNNTVEYTARNGDKRTYLINAEQALGNDINTIEIVRSTLPSIDIESAETNPRYFKQFNVDGPDNVQKILKNTYYWTVFTKATKTGGKYISPKGLPNVEDVISEVLTNPQNNFKPVL